MRRLFPLLLAVACLALPAAVSAQEKSWHFDAWKSEIDVREDGTFTVRETQTYDFTGSFSWVQRDIAKQAGMEVSGIAVYDGDTGEPLKPQQYSVTEGYAADTVRINFDLQDAVKTWIIEYDVKNALGYFSDWDELNWNAVSDDRDVGIDRVDVWVRLPEDADPEKLRAELYVGEHGSTGTRDAWEIADGRTFHYWGSLIRPYENFTVVAGWPKGIVREPDLLKITADPGGDVYRNGLPTGYSAPCQFYAGKNISYGESEISVRKFGYEAPAQKADLREGGGVQYLDFRLAKTGWYKALSGLAAALIVIYVLSPLLVLFLLLGKWHKTGRDPKGKGTIIPQYEPYKNLTPGLTGTLIDAKADLRDITSTIIDLAVRGYIRIIEKEKKKFTLEKLKDADNKMLDYEKELFEGIFGSAKKKDLEDLKRKFYTHIPTIREQMYENMVTMKFFLRDPSKIRKKYLGWGIAMISFGLATIWIFGIGAPIFAYGILFLIFSPLMPARTKKGVEGKEWSDGYEMYLHHAERYRLKKMTAEHFEAGLPYAIVFKVEKEWAKNFEKIYKEAPGWFRPADSTMANWSAVYFASYIGSTFDPAVSSTFTSRPGGSYSGGGASSGMSGFGGGGFSGGGFGGGGSSAG